MTRRVVITGLGTVNPLSSNVDHYWEALCAGKSGVGFIEQFDTSAHKIKIAGEVKNFDPHAVLERKEARHLDRYAQFAMVAAHHAIADSGLELPPKTDPFRFGVIFGSGIGGLWEFEEQHTNCIQGGPSRISPFVVPKMIVNSAAGSISIRYGLCGPNTAVSTACASAGHALADALRAIQYNHADVMISGGSEAGITPMGVGGFIQARALSKRPEPQLASRPFDKDRDGFVLGEGAGVLVLEELEHARKRGARIYAELLGAGNTADAYHITAPHPEGAGAAMAMRVALRDARLSPQDIQYVNAHGTSTELGDKAETMAVKAVFGEQARRLAISSTKSMLGHLLGASGAAELIATIKSIQTGVVHPTINYQTPDPDCDLDYVPNTAREMKVRRAISNSFGFGGHNCCLVVGAFE